MLFASIDIGSNAVRLFFANVFELKGKPVVILGAGGAARAVIYGLLKEGANVLGILNRTIGAAEKLAEEFSKMFDVKIEAYSSENLADVLPFKDKLTDAILIQTTSIWTLQPDILAEDAEKLCPAEYVKYFSTVMDIVYKPILTPLLKTAQSLGKKVITGDRMFLFQAAEQFKLFTEKEPPMEVMENILAENLI